MTFENSMPSGPSCRNSGASIEFTPAFVVTMWISSGNQPSLRNAQTVSVTTPGELPKDYRIAGNASGRATIALVQYAPTQGEDGHFVLYKEPGADALAGRFLRALADGDAPPLVSR